jgi:7-keto-8-aminopelargonate synthetase-like enzyme
LDGIVAPLDKICDLADKYVAMVMVDEFHAAGLIGTTGRGTLEAKGVMGRVDIITGTLVKAMGCAMGGYTTTKKRNYRIIASTFQTLSVFKLISTCNCRGFYKSFLIVRKRYST